MPVTRGIVAARHRSCRSTRRPIRQHLGPDSSTVLPVERDRHSVLEHLADAVVAVQRAHPVRVGIDGIDAAGKTTLANELAGLVAARGFPVVRTTIDGFHQSRLVRYQRGRDSAEGYYLDSFDLEALRSELLDPLGPGGNREFRTMVFDVASDLPVVAPIRHADPDAVLLFDGVFLMRPELAGCWELVIFVDCSPEEAIRRGVARDAAAGNEADMEWLYRNRYFAGQSIYLTECRPRERADLLVMNDDPAHPLVAGRQVDVRPSRSLN
jgi:uridine kinase